MPNPMPNPIPGPAPGPVLNPPAGPPGPAPGPPALDAEMQAALDEHNRVRAIHSAPALTWDDGLASQAKSWAARCKFEHSSMGHGENLWAGSGSTFSGAAPVTSR